MKEFNAHTKKLMISTFIEEWKNFKKKIEPDLLSELSFFEISTLLALSCFKKEKNDINILEIGLGGRFDACNVVDPIASIIVSIDYDHQEWLGEQLIDIAKEKIEICRKNKPLFWGENKKLKSREKRSSELY